MVEPTKNMFHTLNKQPGLTASPDEIVSDSALGIRSRSSVGKYVGIFLILGALCLGLYFLFLQKTSAQPVLPASLISSQKDLSAKPASLPASLQPQLAADISPTPTNVTGNTTDIAPPAPVPPTAPQPPAAPNDIQGPSAPVAPAAPLPVAKLDVQPKALAQASLVTKTSNVSLEAQSVGIEHKKIADATDEEITSVSMKKKTSAKRQNIASAATTKKLQAPAPSDKEESVSTEEILIIR